MSRKRRIDYQDLQILSELQANCRTRTREIALKIGLAESTTAARIRWLEKEGFIEGYHAVINEAYLGIVKQMRQHSSLTEEEGRRPNFEAVLFHLENALSAQRAHRTDLNGET